jgi:dihydrofolate reductase
MSGPISLIAAVAENGVIGARGKIPWRLPNDFAHFKASTVGKPLIMGRATFEGLGRPLPGRTNIVVTRREDYHPQGVVVVHDVASALAHARAVAGDEGEIAVGGGGEIYAETIGIADRLVITHVKAAPEGDTRFPPIDPDVWEPTGHVDVPTDPRDTAKFDVKVYTRRNQAKR